MYSRVQKICIDKKSNQKCNIRFVEIMNFFHYSIRTDLFVADSLHNSDSVSLNYLLEIFSSKFQLHLPHYIHH